MQNENGQSPFDYDIITMLGGFLAALFLFIGAIHESSVAQNERREQAPALQWFMHSYL